MSESGHLLAPPSQRVSKSNRSPLTVPKSRSPQEALPPAPAIQGNEGRKWSVHRSGTLLYAGAARDNFEYDPLGEVVDAQQRKQSEHSVRSGSTTANESDSVNLTSSSQRQDEEEQMRREQMKEIGQLASVFLELRKGIMASKNIDISYNDKTEFEKEPQRGPHIRSISQGTLRRTEKVKAMMNLYYFALFQSERPVNPKYAGVDGVYNPLQIIRNRKIRKHYHEPPHITTETLKLPSEAFSDSKHKIKWQVDLDELTQDGTWRTQHWHELLNSYGDLWFPSENGVDNHHHHHHHRHRHHHSHHPLHNGDAKNNTMVEVEEEEDDNFERLHDKLFLEDQEERGDVEYVLPTISRRSRIANKIKRSKSPFKTITGPDQFTEKDKTKVEVSLEPASRLQSRSTESSFLEVPAPSNTNILTDISIEPMKPKVSNPTEVTTSESVSGILSPPESSSESEGDDFADVKVANLYLRKLRHLNCIAGFSGQNDIIREEQYKRFINYDDLFNEGEDLETMIGDLRDTYLPEYESSLSTKLEKVDKIHDELANIYSTKVDKLLLLSDRTIGEVNTTLSLEVRKLTERFGKLGPLHKRSDSLVSFAYWLLENLVVLLLWMIWVGFSIGRLVRSVILLLWRIVKWVLF